MILISGEKDETEIITWRRYNSPNSQIANTFSDVLLSIRWTLTLTVYSTRLHLRVVYFTFISTRSTISLVDTYYHVTDDRNIFLFHIVTVDSSQWVWSADLSSTRSSEVFDSARLSLFTHRSRQTYLYYKIYYNILFNYFLYHFKIYFFGSVIISYNVFHKILSISSAA